MVNKISESVLSIKETIIYMCRASHVIYTEITISTAWYFNQSLSVSHTTSSSYWTRTLVEPIRTWHTGIIIQTREWPNYKCSYRHYYLYCFIMLIGNPLVKELLSGRCIPCIPGITALNRPLAAETRTSSLRL